MNLEAVQKEANKGPVLTVRMHKRVWRFGQANLRPSRIRALRDVAERLDGKKTDGEDALEIMAAMEDLLRSALPRGEQHAFDVAPFDAEEIADLASQYFKALGVEPGESSASPGSSTSMARQSRRTSRRRGKRR